MGATANDTTEIIALAILRNAVRGRETSGMPVTYRRSLEGIIPGQRLTVGVEKRWRFRRTDMLGGPLLHAGFSLRALRLAGFALPAHDAGGLSSPGDGDDRLREGLLALEAGQWPLARCLLLDVLEQHPACLPAHATLGRLLLDLEHRATALLHLTAAVRLGLGALADAPPGPIDVSRETERLLLSALVDRGRLLVMQQRPVEAAADLNRALGWDPTDVAGAAAHLAPLEAAQHAPLLATRALA